MWRPDTAAPCTIALSALLQLTNTEEAQRDKLENGEKWEWRLIVAVMQWEIDVKESRFQRLQ
jgi:hypothetical protein